MTSTQPQQLETASGLSRRLLTLLVGLLVSLALIVSGAAPALAQNAVGPQPVMSILAVGPHQAAAQTNTGVHALAQLRLVSATGVAAEAGGAGGRIVLGHYPEYVQLGEKLGARTFSMPTEVFDAMSAEEQWAANQAFLDEAIAQGSEIHLATAANAAREGSFYERELQYMQSRGYSVSSDGTMLVPGR